MNRYASPYRPCNVDYRHVNRRAARRHVRQRLAAAIRRHLPRYGGRL
jgi:hypothetical protein